MSVKLKRTIQEWRNLDPVNISQRQGRPVAKHALVDAKHDILALAARVEELKAAAPALQGEPVECSVCRGKGYRVAPFDIVLTCPHCQGSGECPAPQPAEQQPAPGVEALVEALEWLRGAINATPENDKDQAGTWISTRHPRIKQIDEMLAAHRKQGGDQ